MDPDLREELKGEVDDVWAETVRLLPLSGGSPDPQRAVSEIVAVLRTGDRNVERLGFGRNNTMRAGIAADGAYLRVDRGNFPDLILREKDKVVAVERAGEPVFEIQHVDDRSHLRLICQLGDAS